MQGNKGIFHMRSFERMSLLRNVDVELAAGF